MSELEQMEKELEELKVDSIIVDGVENKVLIPWNIDLMKWFYPYLSFFTKFSDKFVMMAAKFAAGAMGNCESFDNIFKGGGLLYQRSNKIHGIISHNCLLCDFVSTKENGEDIHNHMLDHYMDFIKRGQLRFDEEDICECGSDMVPVLDINTIESLDSIVKYNCKKCGKEKTVNWISFGTIYLVVD